MPLLDYRIYSLGHRLKQEAELAAHALALLQDRLAGSEAAQLAAAVEQLEKELGEAQAAATGAATRKAELVAQAKVGWVASLAVPAVMYSCFVMCLCGSAQECRCLHMCVACTWPFDAETDSSTSPAQLSSLPVQLALSTA